MRILIAGGGEVGFHLADRLSQEGHDIIVIESDDEQLHRIEERVDARVHPGNGADPAVLSAAMGDRADLLIAVTNVDEVNLVACLAGKALGIPKRVARVHNEAYGDDIPLIGREALGVTRLINPHYEVVAEAERLADYPGMVDRVEFADGRLEMVEISIDEDDELAGLTMQDLADLRALYPFLVVALRRRDRVVIPRGKDRIRAGDRLCFLTPTPFLGAILDLLNLPVKPAERIFVAGGTAAGRLLAQRFEATGRRVKLLDASQARCYELSELLPKTLVLCGAPTELEVLRQEEVDQADLFIAATAVDETNLLAALQARRLGCPFAISIINRPDLAPLSEALGVDVTISPRLLAADTILRYVRRGHILSVATVSGDAAEALEFKAPLKSKILGRPLKDIRFPRGSLIGAIISDDDVVIADGSSQILPGDRVMVFALRSAIPSVERLFS